MRPDALRDPYRSAAAQRAALLDVQLDERADAAQQLIVGPQARGIEPGAGHRPGQGHPAAVAQLPRGLRRHGAGQQPAAQAGQAEPGALLLAERDHRDRPRRGEPPGPEQVDRCEAGHHAERPVVGSPVRYRVEMAPCNDGRARGARHIPPRPQIAVTVTVGAEAAFRRGLAEPVPAGRVRLGERVSPVPAGDRVLADGEQRVPQLSEAHGGPSARGSAENSSGPPVRLTRSATIPPHNRGAHFDEV